MAPLFGFCWVAHVQLTGKSKQKEGGGAPGLAREAKGTQVDL